MALDTRSPLPENTPVTVVVTGYVDKTIWDTVPDDFVSNIAAGIGAVPVPVYSSKLDTPGLLGALFRSQIFYSLTVVVGSTRDVVNADGLRYVVQTIAGNVAGSPATAASVTAIGTSGTPIQPATESAGVSSVFAGLGLGDIGRALDQLGTVAKWVLILAIIAVVVYVVVLAVPKIGALAAAV